MMALGAVPVCGNVSVSTPLHAILLYYNSSPPEQFCEVQFCGESAFIVYRCQSYHTLRRDICLVSVGSARLLGGTDLSDYNSGVQLAFPSFSLLPYPGFLCFALRSQLKSSASLSVNLQSFSQINLFNTFSNKSLKNLSHCLFIIYRGR